MSFQKITYPSDKKKFYFLLEKQAIALTEGIPHYMSNFANISALLGSALADINWVGFYLIPKFFNLSDVEDTLIVGPFQGLPACVEIKIGIAGYICSQAYGVRWMLCLVTDSRSRCQHRLSCSFRMPCRACSSLPVSCLW